MAAEIDGRIIASFASVPESTVSTVLDSPTAELVKALLQGIEKKVREFDQLKSQQTRLEVELETVTRTNESKVKVLQNSRDKALGDVSKLREDLQAAESIRAQAQSELERIQQSIEAEAAETTSLRSKINSLEASHRDTLSLLDSKSKEIDRLAQDLTAEHEKVVSLRRQVSELEQAKQESSSAATSAKFKQASLEQELELQRRNVEWYENERKQKAEEHQKFRKEKNARVSELQQSLEQKIEEVDALKRSENSLRSQLEDQLQRNESLHTQIQKLNEEKILEADHHRQEVDGLNRLVELQKASADTARTRVEELTASLEEAKDDAAEEIGRIRAEVQEEHNDREAAEQRVAELEARIRDLEADLHQAHTQPGTPRHEPNGQAPSTPVRPGTPLRSFTPGSTHRLKSGLTTTQLFSEYTKLEKELANERNANQELQRYVDEMLADLEAKKPEIDELRLDNERLQEEAVEISKTADQANEECAAAKKQVKILQGQLDQRAREVEEAQQMARDLGSQVRRLILEQQAGSLSDAEYERLVNDLQAINQRDMEHLSEAQQQVNQYLLAFRNIAELQEVNQRQVGTIRNLLSRVESAEAQELQQKCEKLEKDLHDANSRISQYQDEISSMVAQTKSFVKERDMFRSMLTRRGQIDPADFSRSMPLPAGGLSASIAGDRVSPAPDADLAKLLKELQAQYDNYRREANTDTSSLKTQISDLSQRNSQLQAEASRSLGQLSAANQRYDMLHSNYTTLKNDNAELQKRFNTALENATKQELKTQQAAEELVEARGMVDGLRRESATLKAEKDLWKSVEKRLLDDNESLRNERARLDQLNANLQSLLNEKEHSDAESRRRLQSQVDSLETELQSAKRRLQEEIDDKNQATLRRNYEHEQSQKRVDELVSSLSVTREELAAAKTARDHLQARVDELVIELRSAEERLEVFARPPGAPAPQAGGAATGDVSREQELAVEVSELKRDLGLKTAELSKAEEHIEEYKGIAQAAEERLQQFMETNDEDKADLQASLNEKEQKIKDLQQRVEDITAELSTTNSELSKLRDEQAESGRRLEEEKASLQAEIDRLKVSEEKAAEQAALYLEASKEQQKIAEERQQNYETELVKHTEAVKLLQAVRTEANEVRLQLAEAKTQVENAQNDLQQKEASWAEVEGRYKQEVSSLKTRREEIEQHNKSLHASLETLTTQLASLQRSKPTNAEDEDPSKLEGQTQDLSSLNELIRYLRRENEIVEVRQHMTSLELERLKRQLESTQSQLDSTRLKLDKEQRAAMNNDMTAMSNNKLAETVNELNLYRESTATLRAEKNQAQQALTEKTQRVEQLEQEIIPFKARIAELEHHLELKQGELDLLQKDRDSWQQRTQNILSKYDRIDPAELEELQTRVTDLEAERDQAIQARNALQTQIEGFPETVEAAKSEQKSKLTEQFKARDRKMREEKTQLQNELNAVKQQLEAANALADEMAANARAQTTEESAVPEQEQTASEQRVQELEARVEELQTIITEKDAQISANSHSEESMKAREEQLKAILNKRLSEVKKETEAAKQAALEDLRTSLNAEHREEMEKLRSQSAPTSVEVQNGSGSPEAAEAPQSQPEEGRMTFEEFMTKITEPQVQRMISESESMKSLISRSIRKRVDKEKEIWEKELAQGQPDASADEINQQVREIEQRFATEKETLIRQKDEELNAEREAMLKQHNDELEAAKQTWLEEQQKKVADEVAKAKASMEKMVAMKHNMLLKQSQGHLAKINIVKQAAEETPDEPVKKVWDIAKSAKVPAETPKPAAVTAAAPKATPAPAAAPASKPTEDAVKVESQPAIEKNEKAPPAPEASSQQPEAGDEAPQQGNPPAAAQAVQSRSTGLPQPASQLPRGNFSGRGRGNVQGGRGTAIPRPGSALGNHTGQSTRGRGGSRGGHNPSSPSRGGGLNPAAQQFTPQNKRPREEGEDTGNQGKRIRGGGAGS